MTIESDMKARTLVHRKARSQLCGVLQFHLAEIAKIGKSKQRETTDDETAQYLKRTLSRLKEEKHSDPNEISELEKFLPTMATKEEVQEFIDSLEHKDNKGAAMKEIRQKFGALVDMKMAASLV